MGEMIDLKTGQPCQQEEAFAHYFEEIDKSDREALRQAGCLVNQVKNEYSTTHIHTDKKTVWKVTFPVATREDIQDKYAGLIHIHIKTYYLPTGEVFSIYFQGYERASLRRATYYEQAN